MVGPSGRSGSGHILTAGGGLLRTLVALLRRGSVRRIAIERLAGHTGIGQKAFCLRCRSGRSLLRGGVSTLVRRLRSEKGTVAGATLSSTARARFERGAIRTFASVFDCVGRGRHFFDILFGKEDDCSFPLGFGACLEKHLRRRIRAGGGIVPCRR